MNILDRARKHLVNIPGIKLDKKFIILESDDWGSERIPSKEGLEYLISCGIDVFTNPFNHLDSLESSEDLSELFETLSKFRDRKGNHPVITANSVTANPDFEKIKASGFREYHHESSLQTYSKKQSCRNSYTLIREGMAMGIFHPQFHGREHVNIKQWLKALQDGNEVLLKAFVGGIYGVDLETDLTKRANFMASFDSNSDQDYVDYRNIIVEGVTLFEDIFGYISRSFIAPCYIWHPSLEVLLKENGIQYLQGLPFQYAPISGEKYRKIYHYQGERNRMNQIYFIRNCFFEPSLNRRIDWVNDCLQRIKIIFSWGKPAIIGTHRINFIGSLNQENRRQNLRRLSFLIEMVLKTWPDVEFITSDSLGEIYSNII